MKHIVSFSGGKDSTAMLLMMIEKGIQIDDIVFCDTGMEFPGVYNHIRKVEKHIKRKITVLKRAETYQYFLGYHKKRNGKIGYGHPDFRNRWCTQLFKKVPFSQYIKQFEEVVEYHGIAIDEEHPELIFKYLKDKYYRIIGIDEAHFFDVRLVEVIDTLLIRRYHIIISGLMLNFRGEPFGPMPWLIGRANNVMRLTGICDVNGCNRRATRTQRLINGEPASYDSPVVEIEGQGKDITYETRCVIHHIVPK